MPDRCVSACGVLSQAKNQMQEEVESLRRRLSLSEEELETLRKALRMAEGQGGRDKEALDRLNGLLRSAEEQLKTVQATLHQEMVERRTMEARIASRQAQADQVRSQTLVICKGWGSCLCTFLRCLGSVEHDGHKTNACAG